MAGFIGAAAAMRLLLGFGLEVVEQRVLALTKRLIDGLQRMGCVVQSPLEPEARSGIVNFKAVNPVAAVSELRESRMIVSARVGGVRVSPHFYNTEEEVDRLLEALRGLGCL